MKKLISVILSATVISGFAAVPVFADYTTVSYDVEHVNYTYDDGSITNDIDNTAAKQVGDTQEKIFGISINSTNDFYLGFDFRFDNVNGNIQIPLLKSSGSVDKVGPIITTDGTNLRTATGSSSFQTLGEFSVNEWYSAEIEGRTGMGTKYTTFRLYKYVEGEKTLVQETPNFSMRNISSNNKSFNSMLVNNVSLDNVRVVSLYPDELALSATSQKMDAGTINAFDYVAKRLDKEVTKHAVTWSVWNEAGDTEITDGSVTISTDGILKADISSPTQVVTVKATTEVGAEPLTGEYKVTVNAVNTTNEKYDTIVLDAPAEVKAGGNATFTYTASKGGEDVTESVTNSDIVWSIYNCEDLAANNNKGISIADGVLTVDESVLPQDIYVRATSPSGAVYGSKLIKITLSDNQKETVLMSNACEIEKDNTERVASVDGSTAYLTKESVLFSSGGNQADYVVVDLDIKFSAEYAGLRFKRNDGKENSSFIYKADGTISQQTSGSKYSSLVSGITTDKWYHMEILYKAENASCNIYEYGEDGSLSLIKTAYDISRRNGSQFAAIDVQSGTYVDNIRIVSPLPDKIEITAPGRYMFAGDSAQYTATATRHSLPLKDYAGFEWTVLDSGNLPIIDGTVAVDETGLLTSDPMVPEQTVTVKVSAGDASDSAELIIQSSEIFSVSNIGVNEDKTKITKLYVEKNFYWVDNVCFIIAIHNEDGSLNTVKMLETYGDRLVTGENELTVDCDLPTDFNPETHTISVFVWTTIK